MLTILKIFISLIITKFTLQLDIYGLPLCLIADIEPLYITKNTLKYIWSL